MNKERFIIVDDDPGICHILQNIIEDNDLGEVVDLIEDGFSGLDLIPKFKPDIVFVDLLLPDIDGIEIVKTLKKRQVDTDFIMISQVSDNEMISEAYESGIEFYINKPINVIEVISVTKRVIESQRNRRVLEQIGNTLNRSQTPPRVTQDDFKNRAETIFAELGILSEKGSTDLMTMILYVCEEGNRYQMSDLYKHVVEKYQRNGVKSPSQKAIEQRIRRTIMTAMMNIAHLGIEDFSNLKFDRYANHLFGFQEVKVAMDSIRHKTSNRPAINLKLFINGMVTLIK